MKKQKGIIEYLGLPGFISLTGLAFSWIAIIMLINNMPFFAISMAVIAFYFDCLDGYIARKTAAVSDFGKNLDTLFDVVNYLVFSALLFYIYVSPGFAGIFTGFVILSTGVYRLSRFGIEGFIVKNKNLYYSGITVAHILLVSVVLFYGGLYFPLITGTIATPVMILISVLQITRIPVKKTGTYKYWLTIAFVILLISIWFQFLQG